MERKKLIKGLVALNAVLLCILVWLLVSDNKAVKTPEKQEEVEIADTLNTMESQKDSLESSNSSCAYAPGKGAGNIVSGSLAELEPILKAYLKQ